MITRLAPRPGTSCRSDDERLEPAGEALGDGPAFRPLDGSEVVIDEEDFGRRAPR